MTPLERLAARLDRVTWRRDGRGFTARCPGHEDRTPSLSVDASDDGDALICCHAGCDARAVIEACGLTWADCYANGSRPHAASSRPETPPPRVVELGDPTPRQVAALVRARRIQRADDLAALGVRRVRYDGQEWLGFASLSASWKLWAIDADGKPRRDHGRLRRRNVGEGSLVVTPALRAALATTVPARVYDVEGESDLLALIACAPNVAALTGTAGACSLAGHERHRAALGRLAGVEVMILRDRDDAGRRGAAAAAAWWHALGARVGVLVLPETVGEAGDLRDYLLGRPARDGAPAADPVGIVADLEKLAAAAPPWEPVGTHDEHAEGPWARAVTAVSLLTETDAAVEWIAEGLGAPGSITGIASPRGLGKTHVVHALAVAVATGGTFRGRPTRQGRVLLIDRDNSRREIRRRLREWCGDAPPDALEILSRDEAPALTDARAWSSFPFGRYALVILDSLGAATEGVSESDGGDYGRALAPLLDLARRGPAVVVLLNVPKAATHYRGSGVIADRLDILYEVRDVTDLQPAASDDVWWSRLPEAGESAWAERARRRGRRDDYRLALVPTKYRIGEEPDPIALEVLLTPAPGRSPT